MTRRNDFGLRPCAGFTLVELLIAMVATMAIAAAAYMLTSQAERIFAAQPEQSDTQQRLRVGVDALQQDLIMAGAGTFAGPARGPLNQAFAAVMPYRAFGDAPDPGQGVFFRADTVSVVFVPLTAAQSMLAAPLAPGGVDVRLVAAPNCPAPTATQSCGFAVGTRALVADDRGNWDIFSVTQTGGGVTTMAHRGVPSAVTYTAGSPVAEVRLATFSLKPDLSTGVFQLVRHDGWATELPLVDDVVVLRFEYFADPNPPQRTSIPLDDLRGPWTTYGPKPPPLDMTQEGWPVGENCTFLVVDGTQVPRLPVLAAGTAPIELPPATLTDGPWCPDAAASSRFDADLLRIRRVRATLRVQAASAALRGPAGALFFRRGTARAADRYVPDLEVQFDVSPRNLNLDR
jgi:type II secretory pathway pseudopilin PulG